MNGSRFVRAGGTRGEFQLRRSGTAWGAVVSPCWGLALLRWGVPGAESRGTLTL